MVVLVASRPNKRQPGCQRSGQDKALKGCNEAGFPHGESPVPRLNLRVLYPVKAIDPARIQPGHRSTRGTANLSACNSDKCVEPDRRVDA